MIRRKIPKAKNGAWYVKVAGSYLPVTWQAWLLHLLLLSSGACLLAIAWLDTRPVLVVMLSFILELVGLGTVFTLLARSKA